MPTTTASKGGLRAAATAKRTKAAQRTPLPAKDHAANVALAREAVAEVTKPVKRVPAKAAVAEAKPAKRSAAKAREEAQAPINDKAARYAGELEKLGWVPGVTRLDGLCELVARRGSEAIYLAWRNEAHVSGTSTHTINDRTTKVRNPAEAMRVAAQTPDEAAAKQAKVSSNKAFRRQATGPTVKRVPFDPATASDDDVIFAIEARRITWHNRYRVESESAIVGRAHNISISVHPDGHRVVSFVDPETGFRAFRLDMLENVGRQVDLERIKQDILKSLSRDAEKQGRKTAR